MSMPIGSLFADFQITLRYRLPILGVAVLSNIIITIHHPKDRRWLVGVSVKAF